VIRTHTILPEHSHCLPRGLRGTGRLRILENCSISDAAAGGSMQEIGRFLPPRLDLPLTKSGGKFDTTIAFSQVNPTAAHVHSGKCAMLNQLLIIIRFFYLVIENS
jgi:hypothetical protein